MNSRDDRRILGLAEMCGFLNECWEPCLLRSRGGWYYLHCDSLTQLEENDGIMVGNEANEEMAGNKDTDVPWEWSEPDQQSIDTLYQLFPRFSFIECSCGKRPLFRPFFSGSLGSKIASFSSRIDFPPSFITASVAETPASFRSSLLACSRCWSRHR